MNKNDLFHWYYNQSYCDQHQQQILTGTLYWAAAKIAIFDGTRLRDLYWYRFDNNTVFFNSEGRSWLPEQIDRDLVLTYIANLDDLKPLEDDPNFYDDVIDLTHPNSHTKLFIRRDQTRSKTAMINYYQNRIAQEQNEIQSRYQNIVYYQQLVNELETSND